MIGDRTVLESELPTRCVNMKDIYDWVKNSPGIGC